MANLDWGQLAAQRANRVLGASTATTISARARAAAAATPEDLAFADGERLLSFAALYQQACHLAAALRGLGLQPGDVISFQLPNWLETAVINVAASLGGWICNPVVPIYRDAELIAMLGDCRSRVLFVPGTWRGVDYTAMAARVAAKVASLQHVVTVRGDGPLPYDDLLAAAGTPDEDWPETSPDSIKMIMYTSGTTGPAKGVLHSHASLTVAVDAAIRQWGLGRGERMLMPSPVTHGTGYCAGLELPLLTGMATVLMDRWDAREAVALILRHHIAAAVGATPFLQELLDATAQAGLQRLPLRVFVCGGAAVPAELIRRASAQLEGYACRAYGATESPFVTYGRGPQDAEAIGAETDGCINGYDVRVVDTEGHDVAPGGEGEILVGGAGLLLGYTDPQATREAFTADGYFRTGDIGVVRAGTLTITGRKKDLIIRGGENISAKEIEDVLHRHPQIIEASVVAAPSARLGETIGVYLRTRDHFTPSIAELADYVSGAGLARQKCPEHVRVVDEFPRTAAGKVRKDMLRKMIREELAADAVPSLR